ncbi:MAG: SLBB domain-containing protein [Desulfobulbaceae bacterium]|nr:SLBB domain-containing protein [Desulfobulbaceae bacterium]
MNFVKECGFFRKVSIVLIISIFVLSFSGCKTTELSSLEDVTDFRLAGPIQPEIDLDKLKNARVTGMYRAVVGDILELRMASVLNIVTANLPDTLEVSIPTLCRIHGDGAITVPVIGQIQAAGRTLAEIETSIVNAYYPEYITKRPAVLVQVAEYKTIKVSIMGAVEVPGVYDLASDAKSLVSLIMEAGGVVEGGAAFIRIKQPQDAARADTGDDSAPLLPDPQGVTLSLRQDSVTKKQVLLVRKEGVLVCTEVFDPASEVELQALVGKISAEHPDIAKDYVEYKLREFSGVGKPVIGVQADGYMTLTLPVKGLNIPFADVALADGASVEVVALNPEVFSVMGLVLKPGVVPYPPETDYTLLEALAFAGGVDEVADPRFVTVYRLNSEGEMVHAAFAIKNGVPAEAAAALQIKPGDVVSLGYTARTRMNKIAAELFRVNVGVYANPWND